MKMIEDIVLNFSSYQETWDFFEWKEKDPILRVQKIPVFRISSFQMNDFFSFQVKGKPSFLKCIENQTITEKGTLLYVCLLTDLNKVIGVGFDEEGFFQNKSMLLLEEEEYVIQSISKEEEENISYERIKPYQELFYFTRKEKEMRKKILDEIHLLYEKKHYDEIHYLYHEISNKKRSVKEEYHFLIKAVTSSFSKELYPLYEIIQLTQ